MTNHTDRDLMAALFVSEEGGIEAHPEWYVGYEVIAPPGWNRYNLAKPVAAGILRLIRERDEAERSLDHLRAMLVDLVKELPSDSPLSNSLYGVLFPQLVGAPDD
jgi:hypothetical protein